MSQIPDLVVQAAGGLFGAGVGIAGYRAWIIAGAVMIALAALAWWTMKPSRRTIRAESRCAHRSTARRPPNSTR